MVVISIIFEGHVHRSKLLLLALLRLHRVLRLVVSFIWVLRFLVRLVMEDRSGLALSRFDLGAVLLIEPLPCTFP